MFLFQPFSFPLASSALHQQDRKKQRATGPEVGPKHRLSLFVQQHPQGYSFCHRQQTNSLLPPRVETKNAIWRSILRLAGGESTASSDTALSRCEIPEALLSLFGPALWQHPSWAWKGLVPPTWGFSASHL